MRKHWLREGKGVAHSQKVAELEMEANSLRFQHAGCFYSIRIRTAQKSLGNAPLPITAIYYAVAGCRVLNLLHALSHLILISAL